MVSARCICLIAILVRFADGDGVTVIWIIKFLQDYNAEQNNYKKEE